MRLARSKRLRHKAAEQALARQPEADRSGAAPEDPALAEEVEAMRSLTKLLEEVPPEAWQPIPARGANAAPSPARRWHQLGVSRAFAAAIAVVCLALGFAGGALLEAGGGAPTSSSAIGTAKGPAVVLRPVSAGSGSSLAVAYMPGPGQMFLRVAHLPPSPPGTYYELWLMTDLSHLAPVAAFQIGSGGSAELGLRLPDDSNRYVYLDISLQRLGAGTSHSADSVLRGRLA
ncbi:MAG: anti-sigma factor [Solirubrobacterales bacterium]|nr:anti-sigma factor [Solirubrobacterales bacterium]